MLPKVTLTKKKIKDYQKFININLQHQLKKLAKKLKGLKVVHVSATSLGGGVAEILTSLVPLMRSLDIKCQWYTLPPSKKFFEITKKIHNSLQGEKITLTNKEKSFYLSENEKIASLIKNIKSDIWVIHDPQPLPLITFFPNLHPSILRLHIDLSNPYEDTWKFLLPHIEKYDKVVFSIKDFIHGDILKQKTIIFPPAIDPLSPKNIPLSLKSSRDIIQNFDINTNKPLITQISRFDTWKDPLGVIQAYYLAKKEIPELQLALIGLILAQDDPGAMDVFKKVKKHAKGDPDIFLFSEIGDVNIENDVLVNAFQVASDVILQKSIKEGFGLTVAEAMWKQKIVIGGSVGGIKMQIKDAQNGFLVNSPKQAAEKIIQAIKNPDLARRIGKEARKTVSKKFLIPRLLRDYLKSFISLKCF
jgi:trehalose synthase